MNQENNSIVDNGNLGEDESVNPKFINPFTDYGFKKLFGEEASKFILIEFLNSMLPVHHKIAELSFKNTEQLGQTADDRKAIYDIYCESTTGERFIVELQRIKQEYFKDRTIYYATFPIVEQSKRGRDWAYELKPIYCISILDFTLAETSNTEVVHTIQLKNQNNAVFYDKLTFIYLEIPKFDKTENQLHTNLDKWLFYLKNLNDLTIIPQVFRGDAVFEQAFQKAQIANLNKQEWMDYEMSLKTYRDNRAADAYTRKIAREEGVREGVLKTARNLKRVGSDIQFIQQVTGLTEAEINSL